MYDSGKSTAGKEFDLFMKLKDVSFAAGSSSSKFIQQEYENHKAQSFFSEIVVQMRNMTTEKSKIEIIESKYDSVQQKACMLSQYEIIQIIVDLTNELGMEIDKKLLVQKFETSSGEKDMIYGKRREKLNDIMGEIKVFEEKIKTI